MAHGWAICSAFSISIAIRTAQRCAKENTMATTKKKAPTGADILAAVQTLHDAGTISWRDRGSEEGEGKGLRGDIELELYADGGLVFGDSDMENPWAPKVDKKVSTPFYSRVEAEEVKAQARAERWFNKMN